VLIQVVIISTLFVKSKLQPDEPKQSMLKKSRNDFFRKARRAYVFGCAEQRGKAPLTQRARPIDFIDRVSRP
jgi:hypothetical protein